MRFKPNPLRCRKGGFVQIAGCAWRAFRSSARSSATRRSAGRKGSGFDQVRRPENRSPGLTFEAVTMRLIAAWLDVRVCAGEKALQGIFAGTGNRFNGRSARKPLPHQEKTSSLAQVRVK